MDPGALMELRQIDCFLAVATELHFGKAAERLFLAQSSVSEAIRSLEQEIGGRLFLRTSRRVALTELGKSTERVASSITMVSKPRARPSSAE